MYVLGCYRIRDLHRIRDALTGILDFVHCPEFEKLANTTFRKLDLFTLQKNKKLAFPQAIPEQNCYRLCIPSQVGINRFQEYSNIFMYCTALNISRLIFQAKLESKPDDCVLRQNLNDMGQFKNSVYKNRNSPPHFLSVSSFS
jgi:hypothetical protein